MKDPMQYTHMSTQTTTVIHSRSAVLGSVIVNTGAASAVITVYDDVASGASNNVVAIIDASAATGNPRTYNIACPRGLTVKQTGGNADITITSEGPGV